MILPYDITSKNSIIAFAKQLIGKSLRNVCDKSILKHKYSGKGTFGQILEKFYFLYNPNSDAHPDFLEANLELKSSPLKQLKTKHYRAKERLVLNIINYNDIVQQDFNTSSFWHKNAHLLLVFYLYRKSISALDYTIALVDEWNFSTIDLAIIQSDWEIIKQKVANGKAHELSEGDTFYLGACTKGANSQSTRKQPFNTVVAKQRAFSLKQGYVNHIIATLANDTTGHYGKIIPSSQQSQNISIESIVIEKFSQYYNQNIETILQQLPVKLNQKSKNFYANLTKAILYIDLKQEIEEFEKADIIVKTVRLKHNNLPKEDISFPAFEYTDIVKQNWEDSEFSHSLEQKFLFIFFQFENENLVLRKVKFWNMPYEDIQEAKKVWETTKAIIKNGNIVKKIIGKKRYTNFPNKKFSSVSHVRPHAQNAQDTYPLPTIDIFSQQNEYTKHCFWLNNTYVKDKIYLAP